MNGLLNGAIILNALSKTGLDLPSRSVYVCIVKAILIALVVLVLAGVAYFVFGKNLYKNNSSTTLSNQNLNTSSVFIQGFSFNPGSITIKVGDSVTWVNKDGTAHSVTADDGSFNTGAIEAGASKSVTFSKAGTYSYYCSIHPYMKGVVVVTP